MDEKEAEDLKDYAIVDGYLAGLVLMARQRIPFELWPKELQGIAGISHEIINPSPKTSPSQEKK